MASRRDRDVSIEVVSRHQHVSDRTREFATGKAQRMTRFNDRISKIQVVLDEDHGKFLSEVIAHVDGEGTLVGKGEADGYRASMDHAFEKLERQLIRHKEKRRNHKHESLSDLSTTDDEGDGEESYSDVVRHVMTD